MKPNNILKSWKRELALDRVLGSLTLLAHHGFVTPVEKQRINQRIVKWENAEKENGEKSRSGV